MECMCDGWRQVNAPVQKESFFFLKRITTVDVMKQETKSYITSVNTSVQLGVYSKTRLAKSHNVRYCRSSRMLDWNRNGRLGVWIQG